MTVKPAPPCRCPDPRNPGRLLVAVLARTTGTPLAVVYQMSCDDVHDMLRTLVNVRELTEVDRALVAETMPTARPRYTRGSLVLVCACLAAVFGLCLFFGLLLRPLAGFLL